MQRDGAAWPGAGGAKVGWSAEEGEMGGDLLPCTHKPLHTLLGMVIWGEGGS